MVVLASMGITFAGTTKASMPPKDYRLELVQSEARALESMNAQGAFVEAIDRGLAFVERVSPGGLVSYEIAFAQRALGDLKASEASLLDAIELDASLPFAWYDLGEMASLRGDKREAERAFAEAARLRPDHWAGFFRLAELAAEDGDVTRFDALLTKAIINGFDLRTVTHDPRWRSWYANPELGQILRRFLTVYWRAEVLEAFESPVQ